MLVGAGFGDGVASKVGQVLLMLVDHERIIPWCCPESKPQCMLKTSNASLFSWHMCVHVNRGNSAIVSIRNNMQILILPQLDCSPIPPSLFL